MNSGADEDGFLGPMGLFVGVEAEFILVNLRVHHFSKFF